MVVVPMIPWLLSSAALSKSAASWPVAVMPRNQLIDLAPPPVQALGHRAGAAVTPPVPVPRGGRRDAGAVAAEPGLDGEGVAVETRSAGAKGDVVVRAVEVEGRASGRTRRGAGGRRGGGGLARGVDRRDDVVVGRPVDRGRVRRRRATSAGSRR